MNLKATADAIATQLGTVSVTFGANTESATATASLPDSISRVALLVYHPTGTLEVGVSRMREDQFDFPVRLLRDPLSVPARSDALYAWYDGLRDLTEANMDLGLVYVAWAQPVAARLELDGESYASVDGTRGLFDVVEFVVRVRFNEVITTLGV